MRHGGTRHTRVVLPLVLGALVLLTGCDGSSDGTGATSAAPPTAQDRLAQARDALAGAGSVQLGLTGTDLPEDEPSYVVSAQGAGTTEPPAFDGTITVRMSGVQAEVPTIATDGELWVQLPFAPSYVLSDPEELGVPDPATLLDPGTGLAGLLEQTEDPALGERTRAGEELLQLVEGTLPGEEVVGLLGAGDEEGVFDVVYGLVEESWELRTVEISGPFYPPATSTYALTLDGYGEPVTVTRP
ncbi:LppX_LprAFG lipoprotein [Ornithinimicrobium sp. W1679]|uniref:LppX_LprAFG lipoprotein n=1 Tax=Ornithinimicrobium sp. W1679 TaxID=3418770 RepID=UPI003CF42E24